MSNIQILDKETLSEKKYPLKYITFEKPDADGVFRNQALEVYFRPDAVTVLLVDEDREKILLTRQFRLPTYLNGNDNGYLVEACAGIIDEGESPEDAAVREVEEELGYQIREPERVLTAYSSAGGLTEYVYYYIARYSENSKTGDGGGLKEEGESVEPVELSFEDARQQLKRGELRDAKTIILLQHYFLEQAGS